MSYQLVGKSCTRCGGSLPLSTRVGDCCPHCGVRFGGETSTYSGSGSETGELRGCCLAWLILAAIMGFLALVRWLFVPDVPGSNGAYQRSSPPTQMATPPMAAQPSGSGATTSASAAAPGVPGDGIGSKPEARAQPAAATESKADSSAAGPPNLGALGDNATDEPMERGKRSEPSDGSRKLDGDDPWSSPDARRPARKSSEMTPSPPAELPEHEPPRLETDPRVLPARPARPGSSGQPSAETPSEKGEKRIWRDASGRHEIEAELLELKGGEVRLQTSQGKRLSVPLEKLSREDQQYVRDHVADRAEPDEKTAVTPKAASTEDELAASREFEQAMDLIGVDFAAAKRRLQQLVDEHPETKAAQRARSLLKQFGE